MTKSNRELIEALAADSRAKLRPHETANFDAMVELGIKLLDGFDSIVTSLAVMSNMETVTERVGPVSHTSRRRRD